MPQFEFLSNWTCHSQELHNEKDEIISGILLENKECQNLKGLKCASTQLAFLSPEIYLRVTEVN